jgi:hypothetical protein
MDAGFFAATVFPSEWLRVRHGGGQGPWGFRRSWSKHVGELGFLAYRKARGTPRIERS